MSSIFSDPFFRRGATLLSGEVIEFSDPPTNARPIAGNEIVGQVKVFQDVEPTGSQRRLSNRLVYCVAARYKGALVSDASTVAGEVYIFDDGAPMSEFTNKATSTNATVGKAIGVLDEYLTGELRPNDIVWLVVKGPTRVKRTNVAISSGSAIQVSATGGQVVVQSGSGIAIAQQIGDGGNTAASVGLTRVSMHSDDI